MPSSKALSHSLQVIISKNTISLQENFFLFPRFEDVNFEYGVPKGADLHGSETELAGPPLFHPLCSVFDRLPVWDVHVA